MSLEAAVLRTRKARPAFRQGTAKELDEKTGLYYYGARYLDPKYSMWISTDPALGEYIPQAPVNDEIRKNNQNLPGMGGIFNHINGNLYHYAGNNPVKYTDPDGRVTINSRCDFFMNGRSTVLGIQPNRGPNALPSPDGSSPAKELTIGSYGCVVTFFASLASTISGLKITPEIINQYCIDNNLFDVDTSDDYKDQTLLSVENGCKAINGLLEKNNIKNIKIDICQLMSDRKNIIIEACIGIKIFTWTLVLLFTIPLVFLIITIIKYSDYSPVYFYVIICIVLINFGLLSEMLGTKIIVSYDSIIIVKRFFQKNEIKIKDISGYKFTFMTCVKGEYPDNLKIYHKNLETNFNKGLCSKKDMQKLYSFFETNSIIRIK